PEFQDELLDDPGWALVDGLPPDFRARLQQEIQGRSDLAALSVLESPLFLGERLLRDNDAASMSASLEQRLPLVDQVVLETLAGLPDDVRYQPVMRKTARRRGGLPG